MSADKTILITGGNGMVGRNLREAAQNTHTILAPSKSELNLLDEKDIISYLKEHSPKTIIHCAGRVGGIQANINAPFDFFYENAIMGINLINAARKTGIEQLINLGSTCIYPASLDIPLTEEMLLTAPLEPSNEGYALAKISVLKACLYSNQQYRTNFKTILPTNLYGKYDHYFDENSHLVASIISKISAAIENNHKEVIIWGSGNVRREFMYVEELCQYILHCIHHYNKIPSFVNCGTGVDYSVNEYYEIIAKLMNYQGKMTHDTSKPEGMRRKRTSIEKMLATGWKPSLSLEAGFKKTIQYFFNEVKQ